MSQRTTTTPASAEEIAIIGMSGRFPKARNLEQFWRNLCDGTEAISFFSAAEMLAAGVDPSLIERADYVNAGGVLEDAEMFDAHFFGFNPREAESLDPQQRLFMECAWSALEDAGYDPEKYPGLIGVYAGCAMSTYLFLVHRNPGFISRVTYFQVLIGNDKDYLTTHVSYKLNLKGPSMSVQTACSTSLVAVCQACQSLLTMQCDIALAGGVNVRVPQRTGYLYQPEGIYSPDGHCRAFDSQGQGTVFGNGLGVVVLKRLADALADGDDIHAIIKGSAINNDGALKVGYTAPSLNGQAEVIAAAQMMAGVEPETITYIETHGTGTALGDPIEIEALTEAFRIGTEENNFCAIGSVKSNIGHLDPAAGIAGLIKTVLSLKHRMIPPSLHFESPNPRIDFANSPFYVNTKLSAWETDKLPRRAGVSAFGIGGTNAHVVLEEAPAREKLPHQRPAHLLCLSAMSGPALDAATANLSAYLRQRPDADLADVAYTHQVGRRAFDYRRTILCRDHAEALHALETLDPRLCATAPQAPQERPIAFMFSGQGSQHLKMASGLYAVEPTFRKLVDYCSDLLEPELRLDLRDLLYRSEESAAAANLLKQTSIAQPALFVIEHALARLWMEWGVLPQAMIGHSIGEYVAACLAGVFTLEEGLMILAERGRLMQQLDGGSMLAVPLSEEQIQPLLDGKVSLAAVNGPMLCVVSGPTDAVDELEKSLEQRGITGRQLHTSHAFHSWMMDPILDQFTDVIRRVRLKPPQMPFISDVNGRWITAALATDPNYWSAHIQRTVRFADGINSLLKEGDFIFLEVGPGQTLTSLTRQQAGRRSGSMVLSSLPHPQEQVSDVECILDTVGQLWLSGREIDWSGFYAHERRRKLSLPTYPFEGQSYWVEPLSLAEVARTPQPLSLKKPDLADWFYLPTWKQSVSTQPPSLQESAAGATWLVFADEHGVSSPVVSLLEREGLDVFTARIGAEFRRVGERVFELHPGEPAQYHALLQALRAENKTPGQIAHFWSLTQFSHELPPAEPFARQQETGFYSLLLLAQALIRQHIGAPVNIGVFSNYLHAVSPLEPLSPGKATLLGACLTIPQEYPNIRCRSIDLDALSPENGEGRERPLQLVSELIGEPVETAIAYRRGQRLVQTFSPLRVEETAGNAPLLRPGGVYLITGGLGNIGFALAEELARSVGARLVLVGRSSLPPQESWPQWLTEQPQETALSWKIRRVQAIESLGAEVLVCGADVADEAQMRSVLDRALARFGRIDGVIHGAGVVDADAFPAIDQVNPGLCERHFRPKVEGLLVLEKVLAGRQLDFWLLLSSLSTVLGGLGFAPYSAANLFLDAVAKERQRASGVPWLCINWDAWDFRENIDAATQASEGVTAMLPREGVETFRRLLFNPSLQQVVISTTDLQTRIDQWVNFKPQSRTRQSERAEQTQLHARPNLVKQYVAPRNEMEQAIAQVWQELLGIEPVGVQDNFFKDLGGHSLLGTQVASRLRLLFQVELTLRRLFELPTVAELAVEIEALKQEGRNEPQERPITALRREARTVTLDAPAVSGSPHRAQEEMPGAPSN